jgi:gamma-glutamylcyclotransferase
VSERYFAYGSNLWLEQMAERTGPLRQGAEGPRRARLANYRLIFNMQAEDGRVFANIESPGTGVLGVIYCCSAKTLQMLDRFEQGYERRQVQVELEDGSELTAFTYIAAAAPRKNLPGPSAEYLQKILRGARQHGLPEAYIREIEAAALRES